MFIFILFYSHLPVSIHTHTHTHTHIYIYIYIYGILAIHSPVLANEQKLKFINSMITLDAV